MKIHRFFSDFGNPGQEFSIGNHDIIKQISQVLRLTPGESIILANGTGAEATCTITAVTRNEVIVSVERVDQNTSESTQHVTLYCAVLKRENFEWVTQKAVETGARRIVPILTRRTIKTNLNLSRLVKIATEAAEQCGRSIVPEISEPVSFNDALSAMPRDAIKILFDASGKHFSAIKNMAGNIDILIGPEGGWDPDEIVMAKEQGVVIVTLGKLTLRAETAATVATYLAAQYN